MTTPPDLPFHPADIDKDALLVLAEADYLYGLGDLQLRLTATPNVQALWNRIEWTELTGVEIQPRSGREVQTRTVLARTTGIKVLRAAPPREQAS
ncbi:hypothetical protein O7627_21245 [Solwaraspora sp. WMMD1047]|uniref:hypothetical protein n=1 Tax=Solwaraspora sp. WMMD1047 TaxID=3016102 RepID=UPI002415B527|nr:hypothetical protein [Solwaraspora sp. WMMD1047]MDG4831809.1 hypothetical protein [Solwaraspora sp. WMMD1047]